MDTVIGGLGANGFLLNEDSELLQDDDTHYGAAMHVSVATKTADFIAADV